MNRSKIEWCDHTWNPITGCRHNCSYCYARKMTTRFAGDARLNKMAVKDYSLTPAADGGADLYVLDNPMINETGKKLVYPFEFEPTLHKYRMNYPNKLKMGKNIFVGAMSDIFGKWIPDKWLDEIFAVCQKYPRHNYLFLTKNVGRYIEYGVPAESENIWYGTSITKENEVTRFNFLPKGCGTFVSIEPLLEDIEPEKHNEMFRHVNWVIIGAETSRGKDKVIPEFEWIKKIVRNADSVGIPIFMKESLVPIVGERNMRRDFPKQLQRSEISPKMKKKLFDVCAECGAYLKKSDMITLLARSKRGEQPKQFGFMCKDCFKRFCEDLGLDIPELAKMAENITIGRGDADVL